MNRFDEIQAAARDIADWVCADPADRNRMAGDLIHLVGLMMQAVGKGVAVEGEAAQNSALKWGEETPGEAAAAYNRYLLGEEIQNAARTAEEDSRGADLERYERDGLKPVWVAQGRAADRLTAAANQAADTVRQRAHRERFGDDRPLFAPGDESQLGNHRCGECRRVERFGHWHFCSLNSNNLDQPDVAPPPSPLRDRRLKEQAEVDGMNESVRAATQRHRWVTATDVETGRLLDYQHCDLCDVRQCCCTTNPNDYDGPDGDCPSHGYVIATRCPGTTA